MPRLKSGHAPGHVRETACDAFEAWIDWDGNAPEPSVEYEINYMPRQILVSHALGLVWNCTDIVPGDLFRSVQDAVSDLDPFAGEPAIKRQTYAACARAVLQTMRST